MDKNCRISIERVANGYIATPIPDPHSGLCGVAKDEIFVFNQLHHVFEFMQHHFPSSLSESERVHEKLFQELVDTKT